jgi:hypothetical protein
MTIGLKSLIIKNDLVAVICNQSIGHLYWQKC